MSHIRPFRGLRPRDELAAEIIAPPYDVLSGAEAKAIVARKPRSFLRVTRPDVEMAEDADTHGPEAYALAARNLALFQEEGWMAQDDSPCFYLYGQTWQGRTQVALMALAAVSEYDEGTIKKHELTRPDKEQDRVDHVDTLNAHTGLVFLAYRDRVESVRVALDEAKALPVSWLEKTEDGVEHSFRVVSDPGLVARLQQAFASVPALYIADGHHRSAAASRVCAKREGGGSSGWFLVGIFPDSELQVLAYNRVVQDLNGHDVDGFLAAVGEHFEVTVDVAPQPASRGVWTMYINGVWHGLAAKPGRVPDDPVGCLDVAVLQDRILGPLLGIDNPRTNPRIQFVGGIRGHQALSDAVDAGRGAVAFHLFPTGMDQLFAVADADALMPPKSTWFEPKLRGGVLAHKLE